MAEFVTQIRTADGDKQIDYNALANLPKFDTGLTEEGKIADAKAVGDKIAVVEKIIQDLDKNKANISDVEDSIDILNPTSDNEGKILRVVNGEASWASASSALDATQADEGKILTVTKGVDDEWVSSWQTPTDALDTLYANEDNEGKVLRVVKDDDTESLHVKWEPALNALDATEADEGKILTVVNGEAKWESPANAFQPSVDNGGSEGGDGEGDEGDTQNKPGQILVNVDGAAKWESIANAIATTATESGQFLSVDVTDTGDKVAYWRTVIDADKVEF